MASPVPSARLPMQTASQRGRASSGLLSSAGRKGICHGWSAERMSPAWGSDEERGTGSAGTGAGRREKSLKAGLGAPAARSWVCYGMMQHLKHASRPFTARWHPATFSRTPQSQAGSRIMAAGLEPASAPKKWGVIDQLGWQAGWLDFNHGLARW